MQSLLAQARCRFPPPPPRSRAGAVMDELVMGTTGSAVRSRKATPPRRKQEGSLRNGEWQNSDIVVASLSLIRVYSPPNEENRSIVSRIQKRDCFSSLLFCSVFSCLCASLGRFCQMVGFIPLNKPGSRGTACGHSRCRWC